MNDTQEPTLPGDEGLNPVDAEAASPEPAGSEATEVVETTEVVDTRGTAQARAEAASHTGDTESGESANQQPIKTAFEALQREYIETRAQLDHYRKINNGLEGMMVEGAEELIAIYGPQKFVRAYFDVASREETPTMLKVIKKLEPKRKKRRKIYNEMLKKAQTRRDAMQKTMPEHDELAHTFEQRLVCIQTYREVDKIVEEHLVSNSYGLFRETHIKPQDVDDLEREMEAHGGDLYALVKARHEKYDEMKREWDEKVAQFRKRKDEEIERVTRETTAEFEAERRILNNDIKALQSAIDKMTSRIAKEGTSTILEKLQADYEEVSPQALRPAIERRVQPLEEMFETNFKI